MVKELISRLLGILSVFIVVNVIWFLFGGMITNVYNYISAHPFAITRTNTVSDGKCSFEDLYMGEKVQIGKDNFTVDKLSKYASFWSIELNNDSYWK